MSPSLASIACPACSPLSHVACKQTVDHCHWYCAEHVQRPGSQPKPDARAAMVAYYGEAMSDPGETVCGEQCRDPYGSHEDCRDDEPSEPVLERHRLAEALDQALVASADAYEELAEVEALVYEVDVRLERALDEVERYTKALADFDAQRLEDRT